MAEAVRPPAAATAARRLTSIRAPTRLRADYLRRFGGEGMPVPVESIAEDLLGLRIEERETRLLGHAPAGRAPHRAERVRGGARRHAAPPPPLHDRPRDRPLGLPRPRAPGGTEPEPSFCRAGRPVADADRALEREANVFAAELLMPEAAVRDGLGDQP